MICNGELESCHVGAPTNTSRWTKCKKKHDFNCIIVTVLIKIHYEFCGVLHF